MNHRALFLLLIVISMGLFTGLPSASASTGAPLDSALSVTLSNQSATQMTSVIVILKDQLNPKTVSGKNRAERQKNVIVGLQNKSNATQAALGALLRQRKSAGSIKSFTPLWIFNGVAMTATSAVIKEVAALPEVSQIITDATIAAPARPSVTTTTSLAEPNISLINAPALWNLGFSGQGVVIANMDTGVDNTHPDLAAQWRGGTNSWYDPYSQHTTPTDLNGHGTWTMGVMVGHDGGGTALGVAPQAQWIAAKIFNDSGTATSSAIHQSYQWLLDPDGNPNTADAPQIVNNSWALSNAGSCDLSFEPDLQSLVAADIVPVFAAGNYGPNAATSVSPANNPDAFAVGAIDNNSVIYSASSRGATSCGQSAPVTYPAVVAPGVNILTADLYGGYYNVSGTSLAAPHVAGALALLLNALPNTSVAQLESALTSSAVDLGASGPDNNFGAGRIDVLAAYNWLANNRPATTPTDTATSTSTSIPPTATSTSTATPTSTPTATPTATPTNTPTNTPVSDTIFSDGLESGTFGAWSSAITGNGKLSVTTGAALAGTRGMQAQISNTTPMYVSDTSPVAEPSYHARFYFSPNSISMRNSSAQTLLSGRSANGAELMRVQMQYSSGSYQLRVQARTNSGSTVSGNWYTVSNAKHAIEIAWTAASTTSVKNGSLTLWLDGTQKQIVSSIANGSYRLEEVWLGPSSLANGTAGTEYFDAFSSTHTTYIGP